MLKFLIIYSLGCIFAILIQEVRLRAFKKLYKGGIIRSSSYFKNGYIIYILTSWIGFISVLISYIYSKWKKIL